MARKSRSRKERERRSGNALVEEAIHLVRTAGPHALVPYFLGTIPFVLVLLFFWGDMSRAGDAASRAIGGALVLAVAYIFMKVMQALYCDRLESLLRGGRVSGTEGRLGVGGLLRLVGGVTFLFSGLPLLLLGALVSIFPFAWVFAFFQNCSVLAVPHYREGGTLRGLITRAWGQATHLPQQNFGILFSLLFLSFILFINVLALIFFSPYLFRVFTGIESTLTRSAGAFSANSTVLTAALALVYLILSPIIKALYTLRCFYSKSQADGADLKVALDTQRQLAERVAQRRGKRKTGRAVRVGNSASLVALLAAFLSSASVEVKAQEAPAKLSPEAMGSAIEETLDSPRYRFRLPRESLEEVDAESGLFSDFFAWMNATTEQVRESFRDMIEAIIEYLFGRDSEPREVTKKAPEMNWAGGLQTASILVIVAALLFLFVILGRAWWAGRKLSAVRGVEGELLEEIDLEDESVLASQLPEDEWLKLAQEKMATGEKRLALRALFLGTLANLGERKLVKLGKSKSNGDYLRQLARRQGGERAIGQAFRSNTGTFDAVWYGDREVTSALFAEFEKNHQAITRNES